MKILFVFELLDWYFIFFYPPLKKYQRREVAQQLKFRFDFPLAIVNANIAWGCIFFDCSRNVQNGVSRNEMQVPYIGN